jgi:hypothetical protein
MCLGHICSTGCAGERLPAQQQDHKPHISRTSSNPNKPRPFRKEKDVRLLALLACQWPVSASPLCYLLLSNQ